MNKATMESLLILGYGIVIYAVIIGLFVEASRLIDVPQCKIYHQSANFCEVYEKTPGRSVIQGWIPPGR